MTDCFFFSAEWMDGSSDIECLVNDSSVVFTQFVRSGGRVVQATDKYGSSRFSNESMQFCVAVVLVVWWLSGSGDSQMCDLPVDDSSVVLMQFLWSGGRVVEATEKSGTCRLMRAVLCSCSFCGLVAYLLWRQTNLRLSVWLMIAVLR